MGKFLFPEGFLWGAATSDYQIEGAGSQYGKGETFWDRFCSMPANVTNNDNGDIACGGGPTGMSRITFSSLHSIVSRSSEIG